MTNYAEISVFDARTHEAYVEHIEKTRESISFPDFRQRFIDRLVIKKKD